MIGKGTKMRMTKTMIAAALLAAAIIGPATAGTNDYISGYYTGYVYVPASMTNAGDTGLTVSNAYICIPAALLSLSATEAATSTGDVRAVLYSINQQYYTAWAAKAAAVRGASVPTRDTRYAASGTNVLETVTHVIKTIRQFGASALP